MPKQTIKNHPPPTLSLKSKPPPQQIIFSGTQEGYSAQLPHLQVQDCSTQLLHLQDYSLISQEELAVEDCLEQHLIYLAKKPDYLIKLLNHHCLQTLQGGYSQVGGYLVIIKLKDYSQLGNNQRKMMREEKAETRRGKSHPQSIQTNQPATARLRNSSRKSSKKI